MIHSYLFLQLFNERGKCPAFDSMVIKLRNESDNLTDKNITALMSYLSEKCGQPITHKNIMKLYDLLICRVCILNKHLNIK